MSTSSRESYPRHTIVEALCQVSFASSPETAWNANKPGPLYQKLVERFPSLEPVNDADVVIDFTPQGPVQQLRPHPTKIKFSNENGTELVQVSSNMFSFNMVGHYRDWPYMESSICENWRLVFEFVKPLKITRVGMRYINKIPRTEKYPSVGDWLKPTSFIPEAILSSTSKFSARIEANPSKNTKSIVQLADAKHNDEIVTIYDIDMIEMEPKIDDLRDLNVIINRTHTRVEEEFFAAQTERLDAYMNGRDE